MLSAQNGAVYFLVSTITILFQNFTLPTFVMDFVSFYNMLPLTRRNAHFRGGLRDLLPSLLKHHEFLKDLKVSPINQG